MIPKNSYFIEIALLKEVFTILTQYTNENIEFIFTKKNIYIYTKNEYSFMWLIIDDLFGDINFIETINFKNRTYIQLSIIDIKKILKELLDDRQGFGKFIKIGSTINSFIIKNENHIYKNKNENLKIYTPPLVNNYKIEDARYGSENNFFKIVDNISPEIISELGYNPVMYNESEYSIVSQKFTLLIKKY